ncbi:MAG: hypothetical protein KatS3mg110_0773 [Pirellulaceae bacterium]|nr:MAG: hypothetical protein KatS3mg110_0773 [Pirellulaceae bacterium]
MKKRSFVPRLGGIACLVSCWLAMIGAPLPGDVACAQGSGRTYYVRTSGSDSASGGSPQQAWRTISRAAQVVAPGDVVYVGGGTYNESVRCGRSGQPNRPIRFVADVTGVYTGDSGPVVISPNNTYSFVLDRAEHYVLEGFTLRPSSSANNYGIYATASSGLELRRCRFEPGVVYGLVASDSEAVVAECLFEQLRSYAIISYRQDLTLLQTDIRQAGAYAIYHVSDQNRPRTVHLRDSSIRENFGGPYVSYGRLIVENTRIEQNRYWGIVAAYSELEFKRQTPGVSNNGNGLYLVAPANQKKVQLDGYVFANNGSYALYAVLCDLRLRNCRIQDNDGWAMVLMYSSVDGRGSLVSNNYHGVLAYSHDSYGDLSVSNLEIRGNRGVGFYHYSNPSAPAKTQLQNCVIAENGSHGILSYYGELSVRDCVSSQNGGHGLHNYVAVANSRDLSLHKSTISGNRAYGIVSYYADVTVQDCQVTGNGGYAVYAVADGQQSWNRRAQVLLRQCDLTKNYGGPYARYSRLTIDRCVIEENRYWGLVCDYGDFRFERQAAAIKRNGYGVYVAGDGPEGNRRFDSLDVSENGSYGLYLRDCQVELRNCRIEKMQGWAVLAHGASLTFHNSPIKNSGHGLRLVSNAANRVRISIEGAVVEQNSGYGVYHSSDWRQPDEVTLQNCAIRSNGSWAFVSYYGNAALAGCSVSRCGGGVYLYNNRQSGGPGSHRIQSTSIADCNSYGIYAHHAGVMASDCAITNNTRSYAVYCNEQADVPWEQRVQATLTRCTITGNYGGPYVNYALLRVDNCRIENNTYWGLVCNRGDFQIVNQPYAITGNGYGLYLAGDGPEGPRRFHALDVSNNGAYGIYALDCQLELTDCRIEKMQSWGLALNGASLKADNSPIRDNGHGIVVYSRASNRYRPVLQGIEVVNNSGYGLYHSGNWQDPDVLTVQNAGVRGNKSWALVSYYANAVIENSVFDANGGGLYLYRHRQNGGPGNHRLDRCQITNNQSYGLHTTHSSVEATRCQWSGNSRSYAVYCYEDPNVDWDQRVQVAVRNCEITGNYGGPYVYYARLVIDNTRIEQNTYWGIVCNRGDFQIINQPYAIQRNGYGLYLAGDGPEGPRRLRGLNVSENGAYGLYAVDCRLELEDCRIEKMGSWGMAVIGGSVTAVRSPIKNNGHGLYITSSTANRYRPVVAGVEVTDNSGYGIYHSGASQARDTLRLENCKSANNGSWSIVSYHGNVEINGCSISANRAGIYLYCRRQDGGLGSYRIVDTPITACQSYGVYCYEGNAELIRCTISDNSGGYAVYAHDSASVPWEERAVVRLANCNVLRNYGGPYVNYAHLTLDNTSISENRYWAAVVRYSRLTFAGDNRALSGNGYGLYVSGDEPDGKRLLAGIDLSKNGAYGLYAEACHVVLDGCTIADIGSWAIRLQSASLVAKDSPIERVGHGVYIWSRADQVPPVVQQLVVRNCSGYGIYHSSDRNNPAQLELASCRVEQYGSYGLVNYYGNLIVEQCVFLGDRSKSRRGIYTYYSNNAVVDRSIIQGHTDWALLSYGSELLLRNTVLANSSRGAYLYHFPDRNTSVRLWNSTVGYCPGYGIYQYGGQTQVINTIVAAPGGSYGIVVTGNGSMYSGNNLIYGYRVPARGPVSSEALIAGDPAFTDPSAGDFSLSAASAAINQGRDMPGKVDVDILGLTRPKYGKWEIGAYEYPFAAGVRVVNWVETR